MTRGKLLTVVGLLGGLALFGSCLFGSPGSPSERDDLCTETPKPYEPTASDIPLPHDYEAAAERRIGPDNYKRELARIAREISSTEVELAPPESNEPPASKAH